MLRDEDERHEDGAFHRDYIFSVTAVCSLSLTDEQHLIWGKKGLYKTCQSFNALTEGNSPEHV